MSNDRVRDEAERLVAAAVAAVSLAARGMGTAGRGSCATGSPECCVCPVCRLISAMRDPSADLAERLASGAGDVATGVTAMLRALSRGGGHAPTHDEELSREEFWESLRRRATDAAKAMAGEYGPRAEVDTSTVDPWRAATTTPSAAPPKPMAKKAVAKKAVKKAVPPGAAEPARPPGPVPGASTTPPPPRAKTTPPPAKKVVKKAAKKALPPPEEFG
jgi:hypothetical protein